MIRSIEHLVEVGSVAPGSLRQLSPSLERDVTRANDAHAYELAGAGEGELRFTARGEPVRLEQRRDVHAVSWLLGPNTSIRMTLRRVYEQGSPADRVSIIKNGALTVIDPWQPAPPDLLLSSPNKVELLRLDGDQVSIVWERSEREEKGKVTLLLHERDELKKFLSVVEETASSSALALLREHYAL
jgi:hypothetical protein